jgi:hypothetical protein
MCICERERERERPSCFERVELGFFSVIYYRHHFLGAEFGEKLVDAQSTTKQYCSVGLNINTHLVRVHLND